MFSKLGKSGIAAILFLAHCGDDSSSTLHPLLNLKAERVNDTSRVIAATPVAERYTYYRIVDATCLLTYPRHVSNSGSDTVVIDTVAIANDPVALESGRFYGVWVVPDSLFSSDTLPIYACVSDETDHEACASLVVRRSASPPETKQ